MRQLNDVSAEEMMNETPETVDVDQTLGSIKDFMEDKGLRAVPLTQGEEFKGVISYRELIRHIQHSPESVNVGKVAHTPPEFEPSDSLVDVADLRIQSGRKMLVATANGKIRGVIGDHEFMNIASDIKELDSYSTRNLASNDLIKVFEEDKLDKARHKMLDNNISRLPVLDSEGELTGILRSTDLLKMIVPMESPQAGGTSGNTLEDTQIAGGVEKESMSEITVDQVMNRTPVTMEGYAPTTEAVEEMSEQDSTDILIKEAGYPEAILTSKDIVKYIADQKQNQMVMVNLIGLDLAEEKAAVHNKIKKQLRGGLGRKTDQPEELSMHIKRYDRDGKRNRFEVNAKLHCEYGRINTASEAWDLLNAVDEALDDLDSQLSRRKGKEKEHR